MTKPLDDRSIEQAVDALSGWDFDREDHTLVRDFVFSNFEEALEFINHVGLVAEELDHHPEIYNVYNRVSLALSTHDVCGITDKDLELARRIDFLF